MLNRLLARLAPQLTPDVSILTLTDDGNESIGAKRQTCLLKASAEWVCFVDDDDLVAFDYVERCLPLMTADVDTIGFRLRYFEDGTHTGIAAHSYEDHKFELPREKRGLKQWARLPNHLNPTRREVALRVGYKPLDFGEDGDYARRMSQLAPRPREAFVDAYLYDYLHRAVRKGEVTHATRLANDHRARQRQ